MIMKPLDILFIEDSREDIELAKEVLCEGKVHNRLNIIHDGKTAMEYLKNCRSSGKYMPPDVIILDLNIPRKNGFEVLKAITDNQDLKKVPLIIFTTSDLTSEEFLKNHVEFQQYVRKSFDFHELLEAVNLIKERNSQKTSAPKEKNDLPAYPVPRPLSEERMDILLIEDSIEDAELIEELLRMKHKDLWKLKHVERLDEALECMKHQDFDAALLDLFLPDTSGLETLKKFVTQNSSVPVIVMTGLKDEETGKAAIREGAQDYIVKGQINSNFFIRSVEYAVERKRLQQLKEELIGYVNHELSNPLTVIKESVSQIAEGVLGEINPKQKHYLDMALSNIDRLIAIADDLLFCTKLELGKLSIEKERFDFKALVEETAETFQAAFSHKGLGLESLLPPEEIAVYADKTRVSQILTNLLNNALKFTARGGVKIIVEKKTDSVQCTISDTGQGIAPEDIPKLFKKYEQVLSHKLKGIRGTGLGLYICKTLVERHGGKISVHSTPAEGTDFVFTLPAAGRNP